MGLKKINSVKMKQNNIKVVLDTIRFSEEISRKDLADKIGLTPASITNITNYLIEQKYLMETGKEESSGGGRKPILLSINERACYIIGIDLSASKIICILTDFKANILARKTEKVSQNDEAEHIIDQITGLIDTVIEEAGTERGEVKGIGLATPGPSDLEKGIMINPPNLTKFKNYPIRDVIEKKTGIPVVFEHHTAAAGYCEAWLGRARRSKCMVLCSVLDIGIAGSIFIDGKVFHGFQNTSGEIGHMIIDQNGPKCACGNYGCLEPMADARALLNAVKMRLKTDASLSREYGIDDVDDLELDRIVREAENGNELFASELRKCARYVGIALCNIIMILSPDTIVLAGDMPDKSNLYVEEVKRFIKARAYPLHSRDIHIYSTQYRQNVGALGAVVLVLDQISKGM